MNTTIRQTLATLASLLACVQLSGCNAWNNAGPADTLNTALPTPVTLVEKSSTLQQLCVTGTGIRIIHGLDYNHDGHLSPYERRRQDIVCNPAPGATTGKAVASLPFPSTD